MTEIPETAHVARRMYAERATLAAIKAATGMTAYRIYFWVDGGPVVDGKRLLPALPRRILRKHLLSVRHGRFLQGRIIRACEHQIGLIEQRDAPTADQMDKDSRALSAISRLLAELAAGNDLAREMKRLKEIPCDNDKSGPSDQPIPRDIEELRRSVSRKLQQLIDEQSGEAAGEP